MGGVHDFGGWKTSAKVLEGARILGLGLWSVVDEGEGDATGNQGMGDWRRWLGDGRKKRRLGEAVCDMVRRKMFGWEGLWTVEAVGVVSICLAYMVTWHLLTAFLCYSYVQARRHTFDV